MSGCKDTDTPGGVEEPAALAALAVVAEAAGTAADAAVEPLERLVV